MVHDCYTQAQFAVAAYADFHDVLPEPTALMLAGMTEAQSRHFIAHWRVVDQHTDPLTGVSATLFQAAGGGPTHLAVRSPPDPLGAMLDVAAGPALARLSPQYEELRSHVLHWVDEGTLAPGFTVAGHALGGALAAALAAEFEHLVSRAYLYYAEAANEALHHIARALGIPPVPLPEKLVRFPR